MFSRATSMPAATRPATWSGVLVAGPSVQTIFARRPLPVSPVICPLPPCLLPLWLLPELVYTTVAWPGPAAEACQAQFTQQSSDVRTGNLADIMRPGAAPRVAARRPATGGAAAADRRAPGRAMGPGAGRPAPVPALLPILPVRIRSRPFQRAVEKGTAKRKPVENPVPTGYSGAKVRAFPGPPNRLRASNGGHTAVLQS